MPGAFGSTVTVKLGLHELQKPDAGSCTRAVNVCRPNARSASVAVQLPAAFAVAV